MRIRFIGCIALVLLVCSSCFEKGDCIINNTNLVKINFLNTVGKTPYPITFSSIEVTGTSLLLYNNNVAVSSIQLPVDPNKTEATFILKYASNLNDTLIITYRNQTTIPSSECGAFVYQDQVSIVKNPFEATIIKNVNTQLLKNATVNFEIYF